MKKSLLSLAVLAVVSFQAQAGETECMSMVDTTVPGIDLEVSNAQYFPAKSFTRNSASASYNLVPHCHLEGTIDKRIGAGGKPYALTFAVNLPEDWNGRYLFQGGGGLNGVVSEPVGYQAYGSTLGLNRGFAVVSTDSGHTARFPFDPDFFGDQEARMNFYFMGNMRVTLGTRPLVETYYKKKVAHSYFVGCSTGGREGMIMAQRFPRLYDGIVSGAPAIRTGHSNLGLRWYNVQVNRVLNAEDNNQLFTEIEAKTIVDGFLERCDALDGARDGMVFDIEGCDYDPRSLSCTSGETENCVRPEKLEALVRGLSGPVDSRGHQVYSPFVIDSGMDDTESGRGYLVGGASPPEGVSVVGLTEQDVDAEEIAADSFNTAIGDSTGTMLTTFAAEGGKQIFYHGVSDSWFSAIETVNYYERLATDMGGMNEVRANLARLFLVPGMGHCQGGEATLDSFDMITAIVDWVENDKAPERVLATGASMPGVSRPLCPWPAHTQYKGSGDINLAENYECKLSE